MSVALEAYVTGGTPFPAPDFPYDIVWDQSGARFAPGAQTDIDLYVPATYHFTASVRDAAGGVASGSVTVTLSAFHVTASVSPASGEAPQTLTLSAEAVGGTGTVQYLWILNGEIVATGSPATYVAHYPDVYEFALSATDADGNGDVAYALAELTPPADPSPPPEGTPKLWIDNAEFPRRDNPASVTTSSGQVIDYWVVMPEQMTDAYTARDGSAAACELAVDGAQAGAWITAVMGTTRRVVKDGVVSLNRNLPHRLPDGMGKYLHELSLVSGKKAICAKDTLNPGWPVWGWLVYRAKWVSLPYTLCTDEYCPKLPDGTPNELHRNVIRRQFPTFMEKKVNAWQVVAITGKNPDGTYATMNISEVGFIPESVIGWSITWAGVPLDCVPTTAFLQCAGRVNGAEFDNVPGRGGFFQPETLLFKGVNPSEPYQAFDGTLTVDLQYEFMQKPFSCNLYIPRSADPANSGLQPGIPLCYAPQRGKEVDPDNQPYKKADFQRLFKPE